MNQVIVDLGTRSYPIRIGTGLLAQTGAFLREQGLTGRVVVITNPTVAQWYVSPVAQALREAGYDPQVLELPDGESYKSLREAERVYDFLVDGKYDRKTVLIALGGGVIGDLTGFVAATYMRGVRFVQIPTTLLAQVDSSVGGKVAVNHSKGKNLIGAFYQPQLVITDVATLDTLPDAEFSSGMAEVIKHGIILDPEYYRLVMDQLPALCRREHQSLAEVVAGSCRIKAAVVKADETEANLRAILNFGHTIGHALESVTHFTHYKHGEGVALGMLAATRIADRIGLFPDAANLEADLARFGAALSLPTTIPQLNVAELFDAIYLDKKVELGAIRWVLPEAIGKATITTDVPKAVVVDILQRMGGS